MTLESPGKEGLGAFFGPLNSRKNRLCLFKRVIHLFPDCILIVQMPKYIIMDKMGKKIKYNLSGPGKSGGSCLNVPLELISSS